MKTLEQFKSPSSAYSDIHQEIENLDTEEIVPEEFIKRVRKVKEQNYFIYIRPEEVLKLLNLYNEIRIDLKYQTSKSIEFSITFFYQKDSDNFKEVESLLLGQFKESQIALFIKKIRNYIKKK